MSDYNEKSDEWEDGKFVFQFVQNLAPGTYVPRNKFYRQIPVTARNRRVLSKDGESNFYKPLLHCRKGFSYSFMTIVEAKWRWTLFYLFLAFCADWLFFGIIYWFIALVHGDLSEDHLPQHQNATGWVPCIKNVYGFTSTFLFSIEVHTTIAYSQRAITPNCPATILAMCVQCIVSSIFQAFMIGILFAKIIRPNARVDTILFSKRAVISLRDEKLCLILRVGNLRKRKIQNVKATVILLKFINKNNNMYFVEQKELGVTMDGYESTFSLWPISVVHIIDEKSPLYDISAADLLCGHFEILAIFEGIHGITGQAIQARTSYTENDLLWGHRFVPMINDINKIAYDLSKLSATHEVDTPLCSANEYDVLMTLVDFEDKISDKK